MATDKKDKFLKSPPLRFPGFTDEWEEHTLGELSQNISSGKSKETEGCYNLFGSTGIIGTIDIPDYSGEMLLIARVGANAGSLRRINEKCGITDNTLIVKPKQSGLSVFLFYYLTHYNLNRLVFGSGQPLITAGQLKKVKVYLGTTNEQKKISQLLSLLDERIATQNKIISRLESLILGIIQHCQRAGIKKGLWQKIKLSDVLTERDEINASGYEVHSVSVTQGVVNQVEYLGRSFAAKDTNNYNVARLGNIIYTKSPTGQFPYGIIKRNFQTTPAAISPLYGVYKPKTDSIGILLHYWFMSPTNTTNYLHPLIQKGAKNTINISNPRFLDGSLFLPIKDAETIAKSLISMQRELNIEMSILDALQAQKTYLLQKMFV